MYTIKDISELTGVCREQVRRWIRNGKLEARRDSNKDGWVISDEAWTNFVDVNPKYRISQGTVHPELGPFRGELIMELAEIARMQGILERRRRTILKILKRLE